MSDLRPKEVIPRSPRELISRREFARRMGWAPSHIIRLADRGLLSVFACCARCGGDVGSRSERCEHCGASSAGVDWQRGRIDPALAADELALARDPSRDATRARHARRRAMRRGELAIADDDSSEDLERTAFAAARAALERAEGCRKRLQLELARLDAELTAAVHSLAQATAAVVSPETGPRALVAERDSAARDNGAEHTYHAARERGP